MAVESADPERSAARAEALLAPRLPRHRQPGEADLAAVAAPDGTAVFVLGAQDWFADFVALDPAGIDAPGWVEGIDHVALDHPLDSFDEAVLFYRSVLGLEPRAELELAGPDGLVHSRALTGGGVRLAVSVQPAHGLQHVAFACPDVLAAARGMAERGVPPLPMPDNYYDDLAARTELDPELVETLSELGVLYDRDDAGGELLHCFTATVGGRLFFELVQRCGGYEGFGAANSPIRMAAQRVTA